MTRVREKIQSLPRGGFPTQENMVERRSARGYAAFLKYYGVMP